MACDCHIKDVENGDWFIYDCSVCKHYHWPGDEHIWSKVQIDRQSKTDAAWMRQRLREMEKKVQRLEEIIDANAYEDAVDAGRPVIVRPPPRGA